MEKNEMVRFKDKEGPKYVAPYYPIGFIILTMSDQNPSYWFGGTWERIAKGRVLVGVDENDTDFNVAGKTGGSKYMQAHNHSLNIAANVGIGTITGTGYGVVLSTVNRFPISANNPTTGEFQGFGINANGAGDSENLSPYFACYIWCRIA